LSKVVGSDGRHPAWNSKRANYVSERRSASSLITAPAWATPINRQPGRGSVRNRWANRGMHRDADGHRILVEDHMVGMQEAT
jgi:hypothetical protein